MPKYTFECPGCQAQFTRTLKMKEHESHPCPSCGTAAPRYWGNERFGFGFAPSTTAAPGNSGVTKDDYPTADQAVGKSADGRWQEYDARAKVKEKVREVGETHALIRRHVTEDGKPAVEYEAGGEKVLKVRRQLMKVAKDAVPVPSGPDAR